MLYESEDGNFAIVDCVGCGGELIGHNFAQTKILCIYCIRRRMQPRHKKVTAAIKDGYLISFDWMQRRIETALLNVELDLLYYWDRLRGAYRV